jgi:monofunctional biosynthetic peptidoglycan transglycosylase
MVSVLWVLAYRFINPPMTLLMIERNIERKSDGKPFKTDKTWVDFSEISDNMKRAAVSAEDQKFLKHMGFDLKESEGGKYHIPADGKKRVSMAGTFLCQEGL